MPQAAGARSSTDYGYDARRDERRLRLVDEDERPVASAQRTAGERRTIVITGQPVAARRRSSKTASQIQARPDRIALWAVLMGLFLVFMAVATAQAAPV